MIFSIDKEHKLAILLALFLFALRLVFVTFGPIDLAPDEAHYWEWSRYLDLSYYSKPPLVAWLNYLSTSVFGTTHLGVRFFSCLALSVLSLIAFFVAKNAAGARAGWYAFLLINLTPEFAAGGLMMTPDVPSLTCWALGLYMLTRVNFAEEDLPIKYFVLLGVVIGFAGLAKYTTALFYPILGLYLLFNAKRRVWLLKPHIYVSGVISLLMQIPVFYWNYKNDFIGLKHVMGQSGGSSDFSGLKSLGNFLGGQLGVLSPVTFVLLLCAWAAVTVLIFVRVRQKEITPKQKALEVLWYFSAPVFTVFVLKSTGAKVQPNWPVLSVYGGLILLAIWVAGMGMWWRRTFVAGLCLSLLITIVAHDTFLVRSALNYVGSGYEIPFKKDPLKPALGWRGLGQVISAQINPLLKEGERPLILTTRYQTASEMAFYVEGNPEVIYVNLGHRRQNQYDLWTWPNDIENRPVFYVRENGEIEPAIFNAFQACAHLGLAGSQRQGVLMRQANVYACYGYKGLERQMPARY